MAMKDLIDRECGGLNPLMKATSHFYGDRGRQEVLGRSYNLTEDELVTEYLQHGESQDAPQSFRMETLLHQITDLEKSDGGAPWDEEYAMLHRATQKEWVREYSAFKHSASSGIVKREQITTDMGHTGWAAEYLDNAGYSETHSIEEKSVQYTAKELLDKVDDPALLNSEFMRYVRRIQDGETSEKSRERADEWTEEYLSATRAKSDSSFNRVDDWIKDYANDNTVNDEAVEWGNEYALNESDLEHWKKLQEEWDTLAKEEDAGTSHPWLEEFLSEYEKEYTFEEDNPFRGFSNAFEEGVKKLKEGDLISAILLFEEGVRENPEHAEAWQYLGLSQAENEQESRAIQALNRCVALQPGNLAARMGLAVSYTNESMQMQACQSLKEWLRHNPRYTSLVPPDQATAAEGTINRVSSLISSKDFTEIHDLLISAARFSPEGNIDADVQIALGILFNLSGEYDKAIECFQTGLQSKPDDARLWNKLGATLANSGQSEQAVTAYSHALELSPGFIRCRYNLGISCINLGAHNEAVEHFLTTLNMQRKGENPSGVVTTMSDNIWSTLRMTVSLMGRHDLKSHVAERNLERLNKEFNMHES